LTRTNTNWTCWIWRFFILFINFLPFLHDQILAIECV
jgi:hypothetical protein